MLRSLEDILTSDAFRDSGVILLSVAISVFARHQSRNDRNRRISWHDFAVGIDLTVSAAILLITKSVERFTNLYQTALTNDQLLGLSKEFGRGMWGVFTFTMMIWIVSAIIREWGWERRGKLKRWAGIILPNILAVLLLFFVVHNF